MQDTDEAYEDLPIILLKYQDEQYSLFSQKDNTVCLFGLDYKPETIDIPLEEGDQYNTILFDSPLYYTILELKNFLAIEKADVTVRFPSLDIEFHEDLAHVKNLSVYELYSMHTQLMIVNGMKEEDIPLFEIVLIKVVLLNIAS
jgi:hypothetical protein